MNYSIKQEILESISNVQGDKNSINEMQVFGLITVKLDHHNTQQHDYELQSGIVDSLQQLLVRTISSSTYNKNKTSISLRMEQEQHVKMTMLKLCILSSALKMVYCRSSMTTLIDYFETLSCRVIALKNLLVIFDEPLTTHHFQSLSSSLERNTNTFNSPSNSSIILITVENVLKIFVTLSSIVDLSSIKENIVSNTTKYLHSHLPIEIKYHFITIIINLIQSKTLQTMEQESVNSILDFCVMTYSEQMEREEHTDFELVYRTSIRRLLLHFTHNNEFSIILIMREDITLLLYSLFDHPNASNRYFATLLIRNLCQTQGSIFTNQILNFNGGQLLDELFSKAWMDEDGSVRENSIIIICRMVDYLPDDPQSSRFHNQFASFLAFWITSSTTASLSSSTLSSSVSSLVDSTIYIPAVKALCHLTKYINPSCKLSLSLINSLLVFGESYPFVQEALIRIISNRENHHSIVVQTPILSFLDSWMMDGRENKKLILFSSIVLRLLSQTCEVAKIFWIHATLSQMITDIIMKRIIVDDITYRNCICSIVKMTESIDIHNHMERGYLVNHSGILPYLLKATGQMHSKNLKMEIKKAIIHISKALLMSSQKL